MEKVEDVLLIDKDMTLGQGKRDAEDVRTFHVYPNTAAFLAEQKALGRRLVVATDAGRRGQEDLAEFVPLEMVYLGGEQLCTSHPMISLNGGRFFRRDSVVVPRGFLMFLQRKREEIDSQRGKLQSHDFEAWCQTLVWRKNGKAIGDVRLEHYTHPSGTTRFKDIHLARLHLNRKKPDALRCVLVGGPADMRALESDPETPGVRISSRVKEGSWQLVSSALRLLYHRENLAMRPADNYDRAFSKGSVIPDVEQRTLNIDGVAYTLERGPNGERWIFCP